MRSFGGGFKKIALMLLLMASFAFANDNNQTLLDGDLYKHKSYTQLQGVHQPEDIEKLTINGWRFVLMDYDNFNRNFLASNLFYKKDKFALISFFVDSERSMEVLDAIYIPASQIPFRMVSGKKIYKDKNESDFYSICEGGNYTGRIIAIATPEAKYVKRNCEHKIKKIKKAWLVDEKNGKIKEIPTKGIACVYVAENECSN